MISCLSRELDTLPLLSIWLLRTMDLVEVVMVYHAMALIQDRRHQQSSPEVSELERMDEAVLSIGEAFYNVDIYKKSFI